MLQPTIISSSISDLFYFLKQTDESWSIKNVTWALTDILK